MARAIRARRSTIIGTEAQIERFLRRFLGRGSVAVDFTGSNWILLGKPVTAAQLKQALKTTPE